MYEVYRERTSDGVRYGIHEGQGVLYEADFETKKQAQAICDAHNNGAESYEEACKMAGLDPATLEPVEIQPSTTGGLNVDETINQNGLNNNKPAGILQKGRVQNEE